MSCRLLGGLEVLTTAQPGEWLGPRSIVRVGFEGLGWVGLDWIGEGGIELGAVCGG